MPSHRHAAFALLLLALPATASAERGALTFELEGAGRLTTLRAPYAADRSTAPGKASLSPTLGGQLRLALTHGIELGVSAGYAPTRTLWYEGAVVPATGALEGQRFDGMLVHQFSEMWSTVTLRGYFAGYDWRLYGQVSLGANRATFTAFHHYDVPPTGEAIEYPARLPDYTETSLLAAFELGFEYTFWDAFAVGVRPGVAVLARLDGARVRGTVRGYVAWSWYP